MMSPSEGNSNIIVEVTDAREFHCFRLVLNPKSAPGERIEIMLHARSLVDLIHKCNIALCDFQKQSTDYLLRLIEERGGTEIAKVGQEGGNGGDGR